MLQRGMNFHAHPDYSILLMSVRPGAPYNDVWHDDEGLLEYEGHDLARQGNLEPKKVDQPMRHPGGGLTENGRFYEAAKRYCSGEADPKEVQVYEKIAQGVWCDRGRFDLADARIITHMGRKVFRFFLRPKDAPSASEPILRHSRVIPTAVKVEVWRRDRGQCVVCGSNKNLHFDHDVPFSKGGSSITSANVRLLCAKHNLSKGAKIMGWCPLAAGVLTLMLERSA